MPLIISFFLFNFRIYIFNSYNQENTQNKILIKQIKLYIILLITLNKFIQKLYHFLLIKNVTHLKHANI